MGSPYVFAFIIPNNCYDMDNSYKQQAIYTFAVARSMKRQLAFRLKNSLHTQNKLFKQSITSIKRIARLSQHLDLPIFLQIFLPAASRFFPAFQLSARQHCVPTLHRPALNETLPRSKTILFLLIL